jgi:hypothetical protein
MAGGDEVVPQQLFTWRRQIVAAVAGGVELGLRLWWLRKRHRCRLRQAVQYRGARPVVCFMDGFEYGIAHLLAAAGRRHTIRTTMPGRAPLSPKEPVPEGHLQRFQR